MQINNQNTTHKSSNVLIKIKTFLDSGFPWLSFSAVTLLNMHYFIMVYINKTMENIDARHIFVNLRVA